MGSPLPPDIGARIVVAGGPSGELSQGDRDWLERANNGDDI
jgi:hypothetical protein